MTTTKPQTMEEFRAAITAIINDWLEVSEAKVSAGDAQKIADEVIFVGCPNIFMVDAGELSFSDDVLGAEGCLRYE